MVRSLISDSKRVFIDSLSVSELRYECDKIHARMKEVERLKGMIKEIGEDSFNPMLSVLDDDYECLVEEFGVFNSRYLELRGLD